MILYRDIYRILLRKSDEKMGLPSKGSPIFLLGIKEKAVFSKILIHNKFLV